MGDRYIIAVTCPKCEGTNDDVYYAPTCGITKHKCANCGVEIDLEEYTGISYEDASNIDTIKDICDAMNEARKSERTHTLKMAWGKFCGIMCKARRDFQYLETLEWLNKCKYGNPSKVYKDLPDATFENCPIIKDIIKELEE